MKTKERQNNFQNPFHLSFEKKAFISGIVFS